MNIDCSICKIGLHDWKNNFVFITRPGIRGNYEFTIKLYKECKKCQEHKDIFESYKFPYYKEIWDKMQKKCKVFIFLPILLKEVIRINWRKEIVKENNFLELEIYKMKRKLKERRRKKC